MKKRMRRSRRAVVAVLLALALAGCGSPSSSEGEVMDLSGLPTITETQAQMLELIDEVQAAVSAQVPETRPWWWNGRWHSGGCGDIYSDEVSLGFPNLVSGRSLSEPEWESVYPIVQGIAQREGFAESWSPHDSPGSHDIRFLHPDGRVLIFATRGATLISAQISCREQRGQRLQRGADGRIPMPPAPQP